MKKTTPERFQAFLDGVVFKKRDQISEAEFMALAEEYRWPQLFYNQPKLLSGTTPVIAMAMEAGLLRWKDHSARILERRVETSSRQAELDAAYAAEKARQERANPTLAARLAELEKLAGLRAQ
jgi:hypothetical protein